MTQEQIEFLTEANVYIKNVLEPLAAVCEEIDNRVDEALVYDEQTLIDAGDIFTHVVSNISIRKEMRLMDSYDLDPERVKRSLPLKFNLELRFIILKIISSGATIKKLYSKIP